MTFQQQVKKQIEDSNSIAPATNTVVQLPLIESNSKKARVDISKAVFGALVAAGFETMAEVFQEEAKKAGGVLPVIKLGGEFVQYDLVMATPQASGEVRQLLNAVAAGEISPEEAAGQVKGMKTRVKEVPASTSSHCHY